MNRRFRILVDCDGLLADYCSACFDLIERETGDRHTHEEVTHWDLFTIVGKSHLKHLAKEEQAKSGWCANFLAYPEAQTAMSCLESLGEIVIVTSPMTAPHWSYERTLWLNQHFNIPKSRIVHTEGKHYVCGDVFIDDSDEHCVKWKQHWPDGLALLWDAPYNRNVDLTASGVVRTTSWEHAISLIKAHRERTNDLEPSLD